MNQRRRSKQNTHSYGAIKQRKEIIVRRNYSISRDETDCYDWQKQHRNRKNYNEQSNKPKEFAEPSGKFRVVKTSKRRQRNAEDRAENQFHKLNSGAICATDFSGHASLKYHRHRAIVEAEKHVISRGARSRVLAPKHRRGSNAHQKKACAKIASMRR